MFITPINNSFVKTYSFGLEKQYNGINIEYFNESITFLIFYYSKLTRLYVINGNIEKEYLVQVTPKINIICRFDNKEARRMIAFLKDKKDSKDNFIFHIPPLFYRECKAVINHKKYLLLLEPLYQKYKNEVKNGTKYPDI